MCIRLELRATLCVPVIRRIELSAMEFSSAELQEAADAAEFADSGDGRRRPSAPPGDAVPAPCAPSPDAAAIHAIPDHL